MRGQYYAYPILCGDGPRMRGQFLETCTNLNLGAAFISSGLVGWFDAADTSTMTLTGSRVDQWRDKQGSGTLFETVGALGTSFNPVRTSTLFGNRGGVVFTTGGKYLQSPTGMGLNGTTGWTVLFALSRTSRNGFWQTTDFNRNSMMSVFTGERFGASVGSGLRYGVPRNIPFVNGVVNTGSQYKFVRNGIAYDRDQGSFTPSAGALANLQLGGWQGTASPGAFDLAGAFYWNRVLTATELVQMDAWIRNNYGISSVPEPTWNIVVHGNSHTLGVGGTNVATMNEGILAANGSPLATDWLAMGTSGITTTALATEAAARIDPLFNASIASNKRVLIFWEGTNHIAGTVSADASVFYNAIKDYCIARKAANPTWPIVVGTIMPRGGAMANSANYEAVRISVNTSIRDAKIANETWLDQVADVASNTTIGDFGDSDNLTYFNADKIHLTDAGHTIAATYFRDAINLATETVVTAASHSLYTMTGSFVDNIAFVNGQSFTSTVTGSLRTVKLYISRVGSPTGNLRLNLHSVTPGTPDTINATVLATSTTSIPFGSISTTDGTLYSFEFPATALTSGTKYAFAYDPAVVSSVDASNKINLRRTDLPAGVNDYVGGNYGTVGSPGADLDYNFIVNAAI